MTEELPPGWTKASIEELAGPGGLMTDGDWIESKDQNPSGEVRLIQLADIGDGDFQDRSSRFLTAATAERLRCTFLEKGDLLIARMPDPLGRACIFPGLSQQSVTAVDVCVWRGGPGAADPRWLMHVINSPDVREQIEVQASGTTRQRISGGNLKRLAVPVPPIAEQRRIVTRIEALLARTRRARAELGRVSALARSYERELLASAFAGAASEWPAQPLGGLLAAIEAGKNMRCQERRPLPGESGIVKISAVTWGRFDPTQIKTAPPGAALDPRSLIRDGDFLLSRANTLELVGAPVITANVPERTYLSDKVLRLKFKEDVAEWVLWFLRSPQGRAEVEGRASGNQLSMRNLGQAELRAIPLPLPPASVRGEVMRRISAKMSACKHQAGEAARARALLDRFDAAVLARAFRGELVPQNTADEPASALLARLSAVQPSEPRRRGRRAA